VLEAYRQHVEERAALGVPPKPLDDAQTAALVELRTCGLLTGHYAWWL